jgi:hypothetical protein
MKRFISTIPVLLFILFSHLSFAQGGGTALHSDPRLALLVNKSAPESEGKKSSGGKKADRPTTASHPSVDVSVSKAKSTSKEISEFKKSRKDAVAAAKDKKDKKKKDLTVVEPRRYFSDENRGGKYNGNGFRIQIYNGPDRSKAIQIRADFMRAFPNVHAYLSYISPSYRVKVGNFRRRGDAEGLFREARSMYSPCLVVPDNIAIR